MATLREPIRIKLRGYGNTRTNTSPKAATPFHFFDPRTPEVAADEVVISGCSEVYVQGRMAGDFYVELIGPGFCVAAVANDPAVAARNAFAKVGI